MSRFAVLRALLAVLVFTLAGLAAAAPKAWSLVDLGPSSFATDVNDRGDVVGYAYEPAPQHAFVWMNGARIDIGRPPNGEDFFPNAISDRGQIVGWDVSAEAWSWTEGVWTALGSRMQPADVNKFGTIVGYMASTSGTGSHGFVLRDGILIELGTFGGRESYALGVNDRGQVVGLADLADGSQHAFLWQDGIMADLGTFQGHGTGAGGINNHGEIIGTMFDQSVNFGAWIFDGMMRPIGGASPLLFPRGINNRGVVVGAVSPSGAPAPWPAGSFLYEDGAISRLDRLPPFSGYTQVSAEAINDHGWIVGSAVKDDRQHGFVLIPGRPFGFRARGNASSTSSWATSTS